MRLFLAIDPDDPARDALDAVQSHLRIGRLADPAGFHLTLAFLGERDAHEAEALHDALLGLTFPAFSLELGGLGTFGGAWPAIVYAGVGDPAPLAALHDRLRRLIRSAGITLPRERFRPHVTLARMPRRPGPGDAATLAAFLGGQGGFRAPPFTVRQVTLYHSTLTPDGPLHDPLAHYPLTA